MESMRFKKFTFKNGKTALNRVVVPPMASQTGDSSGYVTSRTVDHYKNLAMSHAGLVFVEYGFIHPSGRGEENQLGVDSDDKIEGLSKIAKTIQENGSLAGLQIVHVGGKTTANLAGGQPLGPSAISVPVKGWEPDLPRAAEVQEIEMLNEWYLQAAIRAAKAGFDFVELHAAHGYGFNQWLSPLTNHRTDEFGGGIEKRAKHLLSVVENIKKMIPSILLAVRIPAQDHLPGGLTNSEMAWVAQHLADRGVDLVDVSSGLGGWRRPDNRTEQGYLVNEAALFKKLLKIPIVGVGGILDAAAIDQFLLDGKVDFTAVGRAILKDPHGWGLNHLRNSVLGEF